MIETINFEDNKSIDSGDTNKSVDPQESVIDQKQKTNKSNFGEIFEENKLVDAIDLLIKNGEIEDDKISIIRTLIKNRVHIKNVQFVYYITSQKNCEMIDQFLESEMKFKNVDLDIAIRRTIYLFGNLPIEGQRIGRIIKSLSILYFKQNPSCGFKSADSVFSLTNSILLLNLVLHLKLEKKKGSDDFSLEDWMESNQGKNDGEDFDPQLLERVFVRIRDEEIKSPKDGNFITCLDNYFSFLRN